MTERRTFPDRVSAVPAARHFVLAAIGDVPRDVADAAAVMTSELATNAIKHAHSPFEVAVTRGKREVRVEVSDLGEGQPTPRSVDPREAGGRGLRIVGCWADDWGVRARPGQNGKTVWFTLRVAAAASA